MEGRVPVAHVDDRLGPLVAHLAKVIGKAPRVRPERHLLDHVQPGVAGRGPEVLGVVPTRRAPLPEESHLAVPVLRAPAGAHDRFGRDVAVGHGEAVLAVEAHGTGPSEARHPGLVDRVAQVDGVVGDHRPEDHDAPLVHQPLVALADVEVALAWQASGVDGEDLDRAVVDALVEGVFDREDRRVDPVGQELTQVHVHEDPDLDRLERVTLGDQAPGRRVDDDGLDRLLPDPSPTLVPALRLPTSGPNGVDPRVHGGGGTVLERDPGIDRRTEHALGIAGLPGRLAARILPAADRRLLHLQSPFVRGLVDGLVDRAVPALVARHVLYTLLPSSSTGILWTSRSRTTPILSGAGCGTRLLCTATTTTTFGP